MKLLSIPASDASDASSLMAMMAISGGSAEARTEWCARIHEVHSSDGAPIGHMRIRMRAHWTCASPHTRARYAFPALGICLSSCARRYRRFDEASGAEYAARADMHSPRLHPFETRACPNARRYFVSASSGDSLWVLPEGGVIVAPPEDEDGDRGVAKGAASAAAAAAAPLWVERWDEGSAANYYVNAATQVRGRAARPAPARLPRRFLRLAVHQMHSMWSWVCSSVILLFCNCVVLQSSNSVNL